MRVLGFPLAQSDTQPEAVNAQCNDRQQKPFDPVAEQLDGLSVEYQAATIHNGVFGFPVIHHTKRPGVTDSQCEHCNQNSKNATADELQQASVKI